MLYISRRQNTEQDERVVHGKYKAAMHRCFNGEISEFKAAAQPDTCEMEW